MESNLPTRLKPSFLKKKRKELECLSKRRGSDSNESCCYFFIRKAMAIVAVLIAILYTWFANYPEPPISPILFQWQEMGKTFTYKGYNIFYFDKIRQPDDNSTDINTLLYLHGFPTSGHDLYKLIKPLQTKFNRILAPDFIGFGFSDKPRFYSYSIKDQANLINELMKHLDLKNVHILSHDYGDSVAQELLALQKESSLYFRISSVCMLNGGIFVSHHHPVLMQKLLQMPIVGKILSKLANYSFFSISISEVFGPNTKPMTQELHDFWKLIRINNGYRIWGELLSYISERLEHEERWLDSIQHCQVPLHFIYGPADPVNPPPFDEFYKKLIYLPSIQVLDPTIGHYPQIEAPDQVIESYFKFLLKNNFFTSID